MTAPGSTVTTRGAAPPRSAPDDTSVFFLANFTEQGPTTPQVIQNLDDYTAKYGARVSWGYGYDALDAYFNEGGSKAIFARVIGPTPVKATHTFLSSSPDNALVVTADWYGAYGNNISVAILAGVSSGYRVQVSYNGVIVETSGDLTVQADAVAWSAGSAYVTITLGNGTHVPADITATALAGGTDDHADATDTNHLAAIAQFTADLGPGQVAMPGRSTAAAHANLIAHAVANNRRYLLDFADSGDRATLVTAAGVDRLVSGSSYGAAFAPWAIIPGLTSGTTRTVPYSAIQAGIIARNDNAGVSQNQPSAGVTYGVSRYAIGLSQAPWSEGDGGDRDLLNAAGVNVALIKNGSVTTYGYRTLADPTDDTKWLEFSNSRLVMEIVAKTKAILDTYVFSQIDGRGLLFSDLQSDIRAELIPYYTEGSLFGDTVDDAFVVDVGPQVNTADTIAAQQLNAVVSLRMSPFAELVSVQIVTTANTQGVS